MTMATTPTAMTTVPAPTAPTATTAVVAVPEAAARRSPRLNEWKLVVEHQMADDDPAERAAGIKVWGFDSTTGPQDCACHMWRNLSKKCAGLADGDIKVLQAEFEAMKVLPTERLGLAAVELFDQRWAGKAPAGMAYFREKAKTFRWMRAQCGPGT